MYVLRQDLLKAFIKEVRAKKIKMIFARPPFNLAAFDEPIFMEISRYSRAELGSRNFELIRFYRHEDRLAAFIKNEQLSFIDTNRAFLDKVVHEKANLFWDYIHVTDAGHDLLAEYFAKELTRLSVFTSGKAP